MVEKIIRAKTNTKQEGRKMTESTMRLQHFAWQCYSIAMQEPNGKTVRYTPCQGTLVSVEIVPSMGASNEREWDQVTMNGKSVGNRSGAVTEFAKIVAESKPEITF